MALAYNLESNPARWKVVMIDHVGKSHPFWSWCEHGWQAERDAHDAFQWDHGRWPTSVAAVIRCVDDDRVLV